MAEQPQTDWPERIADEAELEEVMSRPSDALAADLARVPGDVIVLGVAGKVGPTLARMCKRAAPERRVVGVARFTDAAVRDRLEAWGIETLRCDLLEREQVEALPKLPNVIYMAGKKFGTTEDPPFAWAMNAYVPALVADAFRASRIVAFSTLCVYPFAPAPGPGCDETTPPEPHGEYANSCVARERIFQHFSAWHGTPGRLIRLNYAIDLRYGILHDLATWVRAGPPIPLDMAYANVIWQGDADEQILRALAHCETPASPLNIGGAEPIRIRDVATAYGRRFGRDPVFSGTEGPSAWLNSTALAQGPFGQPRVPLERMMEWVADWVERDMPHHGKPTRYEVRDGRF